MFLRNFSKIFFRRSPLANVVEDKCPAKPKVWRRKLLGADFQSSNEHHLKLVRDMGITIVSLSDGRVQLLHNFANVRKKPMF
jgi:mannosidase alpha-like ER degradation enhancer 3